VVQVYRNEKRHLSLAESLPLVYQPNISNAGSAGNGTTVAVLDTGVDYTHPAFGSCSAPGVPAECKISIAQDIAPDDANLDDNGHGTNVAGIVLGVAPGARVAALDVFRQAPD
jgi:subtilisin family serine protease